MSSSEPVNPKQNDTPSSVISKLISEIKQSIETRVDLFKTEIKQKLPRLRSALLLGVTGGVFLAMAYLFFPIAAVVLIASAFPQNPYRWLFGFFTVGILTVGFGAIGAFVSRSTLNLRSILPKRTLGVLKDDRDWVASEIRRHKS